MLTINLGEDWRAFLASNLFSVLLIDKWKFAALNVTTPYWKGTKLWDLYMIKNTSGIIYILTDRWQSMKP
jgi:hypothetical protein